MKKLICRLFGHKEARESRSFVRCKRCGCGSFTAPAFSKEVIEILKRNTRFLALAVFALAASLSAQVSNPGASVVATLDLTAQTATVSSRTLYTVPASGGIYEIFCYDVITTAAQTSSTLPACQAQWVDRDTGAATAFANMATSSTANTVGTTNFAAGGNSKVISAGAGALTFQSGAYASVGSPAMAFAMHVVVVQIK